MYYFFFRGVGWDNLNCVRLFILPNIPGHPKCIRVTTAHLILSPLSQSDLVSVITWHILAAPGCTWFFYISLSESEGHMRVHHPYYVIFTGSISKSIQVHVKYLVFDVASPPLIYSGLDLLQ